MQNHENTIEDLRRFAEQRLKEHIAELETKYGNEQLPTTQEKQRAFDNHIRQFREELSSRLHDVGENIPGGKKELDNLVQQYEVKFRENYNSKGV